MSIVQSLVVVVVVASAGLTGLLMATYVKMRQVERKLRGRVSQDY